MDRLVGKVSIIVGAGQAPGEMPGNGRATAVRFAQEGARVACVDSDVNRAGETASLITAAGGEAFAIAADVTDTGTLEDMVNAVMDRWGRIDVLHNNVGVSVAAGDAPLSGITDHAFDRICAINLRGMVMTCQMVFPIMIRQENGVIINMSSTAAISTNPNVAYKATKAAVIAFTQQLANEGAPFGVRANSILPGLLETPMAIDTRVRETGADRATLVAERGRRVPLRGKMGSAMDVANAALFLASDEAAFITGVALAVDGGATARVG